MPQRTQNVGEALFRALGVGLGSVPAAKQQQKENNLKDMMAGLQFLQERRQQVESAQNMALINAKLQKANIENAEASRLALMTSDERNREAVEKDLDRLRMYSAAIATDPGLVPPGYYFDLPGFGRISPLEEPRGDLIRAQTDTERTRPGQIEAQTDLTRAKTDTERVRPDLIGAQIDLTRARTDLTGIGIDKGIFDLKMQANPQLAGVNEAVKQYGYTDFLGKALQGFRAPEGLELDIPGFRAKKTEPKKTLSAKDREYKDILFNNYPTDIAERHWADYLAGVKPNAAQLEYHKVLSEEVGGGLFGKKATPQARAEAARRSGYSPYYNKTQQQMLDGVYMNKKAGKSPPEGADSWDEWTAIIKQHFANLYDEVLDYFAEK